MPIVKEEHVVEDMSSGAAGDIDTDAILAKMGGKGGSYTEVKPDGTTVTYEVDVEEFEVRASEDMQDRE